MRPSNLPVTSWDVWNEPNSLWPGNPDQLLELFRRTDAALRSVDPTAKIVGPSIGGLEDSPGSFEAWMVPFLDYVAANGLHLGAVSWHEFAQPEDILLRTEQMRAWIADRPALCDPDCPGIHINEYAPRATHAVPASIVEWLTALEASGVDAANRACWDVVDANGEYSDCWDGLNGLFLSDNETPTALYWLYRAYNQMRGSTRLSTPEHSERTAVLASRDSMTGEVRILAGYLPDPTCITCSADPLPLDLYVVGSPVDLSTVTVDVEHLEYSQTFVGVPLPVRVETATVTSDESSVAVGLPAIPVGDAYLVVIRPGGNG